jgi:hypothetical protein
MQDIKAAGEAGLAGLGYVSVLSAHAPYDVVGVAADTSGPAPAAIDTLGGEGMTYKGVAVAAADVKPATGGVGVDVEGGVKDADSVNVAVPAGKGSSLPLCSTLPPGLVGREEVREACRKYAEAAAALQGYDLGMPSDNARVRK